MKLKVISIAVFSLLISNLVMAQSVVGSEARKILRAITESIEEQTELECSSSITNSAFHPSDMNLDVTLLEFKLTVEVSEESQPALYIEAKDNRHNRPYDSQLEMTFHTSDDYKTIVSFEVLRYKVTNKEVNVGTLINPVWETQEIKEEEFKAICSNKK